MIKYRNSEIYIYNFSSIFILFYIFLYLKTGVNSPDFFEMFSRVFTMKIERHIEWIVLSVNSIIYSFLYYVDKMANFCINNIALWIREEYPFIYLYTEISSRYRGKVQSAVCIRISFNQKKPAVRYGKNIDFTWRLWV